MLFHVVNERHRRHRAMIFTTNKALMAWGRVLHDEDLGQAIIDRVLESDQDDEVARISGIKWPEFPELTIMRLNFRLDDTATVRVVCRRSSILIQSGRSQLH